MGIKIFLINDEYVIICISFDNDIIKKSSFMANNSFAIITENDESFRND